MSGNEVSREGINSFASSYELRSFLDRIEELENRIAELEERLLIEIARDRKRLTALERPELGELAKARLDQLHYGMRRNHVAQISFSGAGKMLGISRQRVYQLKEALAMDPRFELAESNKKMMIKLTSAKNR